MSQLLDENATAGFSKGEDANTHGDMYVSTTTFFALAPFFLRGVPLVGIDQDMDWTAGNDPYPVLLCTRFAGFAPAPHGVCLNLPIKKIKIFLGYYEV